jgi:hypothetical protein
MTYNFQRNNNEKQDEIQNYQVIWNKGFSENINAVQTYPQMHGAL